MNDRVAEAFDAYLDSLAPENWGECILCQKEFEFLNDRIEFDLGFDGTRVFRHVDCEGCD